MKSEYKKDMLSRINWRLVQDPSGTDVLYNHAIRCVSQFLKDNSGMLDLGMNDAAIDLTVAHIIEKYLLPDPESNEEFAFNNGLNDAIDIIRSYKIF